MVMPDASDPPTWREILMLGALAAVCLATYGVGTRHGPALADEYIYLAGAQHFARTGHLDARFYDAHAILRQGYPHQDNHAPGFVLLLGSLVAIVKGGYWTAVALNVAAYLAAALLTRALALGLGMGSRAAWGAGALFLVLPAYLAYVYWVMPEVVLGTLFLATLVCAVRYGERTAGAACAGLLFGAAFLVRESVLFGLPAILALLRGRARIGAFVVTAAAFGLLVYAPLSAHRSEGASNFWKPTGGQEFGFQVAAALRGGDLRRSAGLALDRASMNLAELKAESTTSTEQGILALFVLLPLGSLSRWKSLTTKPRRLLGGLLVGYSALVLVMVAVYVVVRWAGFRYLMFLMPAFLPFVVSAPARPGADGTRWALPAVLAIVCVLLDGGVFEILKRYKTSRQLRQAGISAYVERYVDPQAASRVALPNGWLFGLKHSVEVISSLPEQNGDLLALEQAVWFDYLALPGGSPLVRDVDARLRYRRLNAGDREPPFAIYRRLR
jgi:hypothetical protein